MLSIISSFYSNLEMILRRISVIPKDLDEEAMLHKSPLQTHAITTLPPSICFLTHSLLSDKWMLDISVGVNVWLSDLSSCHLQPYWQCLPSPIHPALIKTSIELKENYSKSGSNRMNINLLMTWFKILVHITQHLLILQGKSNSLPSSSL